MSRSLIFMHDLSLFYSRLLRISEKNLEFEAIFGYNPDHPPNKVNPKPRSKKTKGSPRN